MRDRTITSLSGGQKQKVAIASILALSPRVLVLDEPTAELDPASSRSVFELLARYAREHGATVVVVEQKIALLSQYADMLVIVDEGRIRFADAPAKVLAHSGELERIGVNCPRSTTLMNRLRAEGLYQGPSVRNVREALRGVGGGARMIEFKDVHVSYEASAPYPEGRQLRHRATASSSRSSARTGRGSPPRCA